MYEQSRSLAVQPRLQTYRAHKLRAARDSSDFYASECGREGSAANLRDGLDLRQTDSCAAGHTAANSADLCQISTVELLRRPLRQSASFIAEDNMTRT